MLRYWKFGILGLSLLCLIVGAYAQQDQKLITIAVLPFENTTKKEEDEWLRIAIMEHVMTDIHIAKSILNRRIWVVERERIYRALEELGRGLQGEYDPKTAKQVGKLVTADMVAIGSYEHPEIEEAKDEICILGRLVDVETGKATHMGQVRGIMKNIFSVLDQVAVSILRSDRIILSGEGTVEQTIRDILKEQPKPTVRFYKSIWEVEAAPKHEDKMIHWQVAEAEVSSIEERVVLSKSYSREGEFKRALLTLGTVTPDAMDSVDQFQIYLGRGDTYARRGGNTRAIEEYKYALRIHEDPEVRLKLARVYFVQSYFSKSLEEYERVLDLRSNDIDAHLGVAAVRFGQGNPDEAVDFAAQAVELSGGNSKKALYTVAKYCALSGRREEAIEWLRELLQKGFQDYERLQNDPAFEDIPVDDLIEEAGTP